MLTKCFIYLHIFRSIKRRWWLYSVFNTYFEVDLRRKKEQSRPTGATAMQFFICVEDVRALCHDTVSMWYANLIFRVRRRRRRIQTQWGSESADGFEEIRTFFRSMGIPLRPQSCSSRRKKNRKIPAILQAPTWPNSFSVACLFASFRIP